VADHERAAGFNEGLARTQALPRGRLRYCRSRGRTRTCDRPRARGRASGMAWTARAPAAWSCPP